MPYAVENIGTGERWRPVDGWSRADPPVTLSSWANASTAARNLALLGEPARVVEAKGIEHKGTVTTYLAGAIPQNVIVAHECPPPATPDPGSEPAVPFDPDDPWEEAPGGFRNHKLTGMPEEVVGDPKTGEAKRGGCLSFLWRCLWGLIKPGW